MTQTNDPPSVLDIGLIPNSNEKADLNAPSNSGGKLVIGQAPNITITETTVVADADERLALDVQEGDIAIQTNVSTSFIFTGGDNIATNWETLDFDAIGAIDGETISPANVNISGSINGADTSAAAAGEALTSDGSGSLQFLSLSGSQVLRNGSAIEYVALDVSNLPPETGSGEVALLTGSNEYVQDNPPSGFFDITTASFDTDIPSQDSSPLGITWNNDGSRLYTVGSGSSQIYQYTVSTPYDIDTASLDTDIPSQDSRPADITWNDDGSQMYEVGNSNNRIYQYTVSTPFDIDTASLDTDIPSQGAAPSGMTWNNDGSRLYAVSDSTADEIYQYTVSTPYDIDTASLETDIPTQDGRPKDIAWNDDGSLLYELGGTFEDSKIYQYTVSTPFDIDTASLDTDIPTQDKISEGIAWNDDGTRLYEVGSVSEKIYQYTLSTGGWEAF